MNSDKSAACLLAMMIAVVILSVLTNVNVDSTMDSIEKRAQVEDRDSGRVLKCVFRVPGTPSTDSFEVTVEEKALRGETPKAFAARFYRSVNDARAEAGILK